MRYILLKHSNIYLGIHRSMNGKKEPLIEKNTVHRKYGLNNKSKPIKNCIEAF